MPESGRTSLRVSEPEIADLGERPGLPARRDDDLRSYLPGVEPERQLNDWGRSERVEGFMDRTLVDFFPEGRKGTEKVYRDRYRLRRFGRGGFVEAAMRARVPIVPVCVVGAEEAAPIFAHLTPLAKLTGLTYFPITPTFPHFGLLGMLGYLPAKFRIRFLEPFHFDAEGLYEDKALVQTVAQEIRARIQENVWEMVKKRKSVWFG